MKKKKIIIAVICAIIVISVACAVVAPSVLHGSGTPKQNVTEEVATPIEAKEVIADADTEETSEETTENVAEATEADMEESTSNSKEEVSTTENVATTNNNSKKETTTEAPKPQATAPAPASTVAPATPAPEAHTHTWTKVVDSPAWDEYEEVPVYETQTVIVATHYWMRNGMDVAGWTETQKGEWCNQHCPYSGFAPDPICCASEVKIEKEYADLQVQTGTEKVLKAHHAEVAHYECPCGAIK